MLRSRLFAEWAILLAGMVALLIVAQQRGWTERFDLMLLDLEGQVSAPELSPSLALVEIDDASLDEVGSWPWSRATHAELITRLDAAGAAIIAVDVLFIEPSTEEADDALAAAIAKSGAVVLPHSFAPKPDASSGEIPLYPLDRLRENARATGHVALTPDEDGVTRGFQLSREIEGKAYPHFSSSVAALAQQSADEGGHDRTSAIIRFGNADSIPREKAANVLSGAALDQFFDGKIVFVGATAPGLGDRYSVPAHAGGLMSGVEMQVHLTNAILGDELIAAAPETSVLAIQILAIVLLFLTFWRLSPRAALLAALALIVGLFALSIGVLIFANIWVPVGGALLAIIIAYPLWGWRRLASVSRFLETEAAALSNVASRPRRKASEGFDIVAQQVARLKRLTGDVSNSLRLVQDVINASPDAMLVADGKRQIVMGNLAAEELFGAMREAEGQSLSELIASVAGRFDDDGDELTLSDGRTFWVASAAIDPSVGSEVWALREITELKEAERQRRETLEFLSHDMRSPQVAIIGLAGKAGDALDENDRNQRIEDQARRTLKLTDDFVQIARIANEGVAREETELNSVIQEAADRAFALAHRKTIKIICTGSDEPCFAVVDPSAMARMLDNLLGNAIKFSQEGSSVRLSLDVSEKSTFRLIVSDEGPGLPPERVERPFERFGSSNSKAGPSAGLGLAYVKQVVELHEGTIEIDTAEGEGTRFQITLPYS